MSGALEAEPTLLERTASPWWTLWMAAVGAGVALAVGLVAFPIQGDARGVGICYSLYSSSIFQFAAWLTISITSIFHYIITRKSCIGATQGASGNIILAIVILLGMFLGFCESQVIFSVFNCIVCLQDRFCLLWTSHCLF
jgi:hypothetical protein